MVDYKLCQKVRAVEVFSLTEIGLSNGLVDHFERIARKGVLCAAVLFLPEADSPHCVDRA